MVPCLLCRPWVMPAQVQALQACMQAVAQHLAGQRLAVDQDCRAATAALQATTARLQLELSSAGNIWLEESRPSDAWLQSCQELVRSFAPPSNVPHEQLQVCVCVGVCAQWCWTAESNTGQAA